MRCGGRQATIRVKSSFKVGSGASGVRWGVGLDVWGWGRMKVEWSETMKGVWMDWMVPFSREGAEDWRQSGVK